MCPKNVTAQIYLSLSNLISTLASGHGDMVLIWNLDSASIVSGAVTLDSQFDFIGYMVLSQTDQLIMLTRFNGRLRIYKDLFQNKYGEHVLDVVPKKVSLSSYALAFSYQYQDECPWFFHYKLTIYRVSINIIEIS